ncbi:MAG: NAD(P)/FAD-dependent oxidoreductase [Deltaproteobacteria bacterium]|nr:NAD(P)/FAD-dependent oxidoreductase [Deltaproteobacteria bacterium]
MTEHFDAIIVGGGHNGLTAAGYLGKAGFKTIVLERLSQVGGAVVTEEIYPGHRISAVSYVVSLLRPEIIEDLELKKHGFEMLKMDGTLAICNNDYLFLTGDEKHDRKEVGRFSDLDYDAMQRFEAVIQHVGAVIRNQMLREPPKLGVGLSDLKGLTALAGMGWDIKKLTPELRHRLFQMLLGSADDFIQRWFHSSMIKNMYASACFSGNFASLRQPGSAIPFLHSAIGEIEGERGAWRLVKGGMGALTRAMAGFAQSKGVQIRTHAAVERILTQSGGATGVRLVDGEVIGGRCVLANTDPKRTFLKLIKPEQLDSDFVRDIRQYRMGHSSLRLNLALKGLPDIKFFPAGEGPWHRSDIMMFPGYEAMEANYFAAATGQLPDEPRLEITIPSTLDDSLAPPGHHVVSILAKYYPYKMADERSWDDIKEDVADRIVDYMARVMPNLPGLVIGRQMISPLDLETIYGLTESDIFHGRHDMDQIFSMRPHPQAAQYETPVKGLYLCGSGAHPGGGVSGAPGYNAARRVITDLKRRRR